VYCARRNINRALHIEKSHAFESAGAESVTRVTQWVMIFVAAWKCVTEKSLAAASISLVYLRACRLLDRSAESRIKEDAENINRYRTLFTIRAVLTFKTALEIGIESILSPFTALTLEARELDHSGTRRLDISPSPNIARIGLAPIYRSILLHSRCSAVIKW